MDSTGCITQEEFEKKLSDERVIAYFNAMKLDVGEARILFNLLDHDRSREISVDEFLEGCFQLQGEARHLDTKIMQYEIRTINLKLDHLNSLHSSPSTAGIQP